MSHEQYFLAVSQFNFIHLIGVSLGVFLIVKIFNIFTEVVGARTFFVHYYLYFYSYIESLA